GVLLVGRQGNRVGDHDLFQVRVHQLLDRVAGEHPMGGEDPNAGRAFGAQRLGDANERAAGRNQVVDDDGVHALHFANDALLADDVVLWAAFVGEGDRQVEQPGHVADALGAADVGRNDHRVRQAQLFDVVDDQFFGGEVIDRDVEEPLDRV